jgi:hypothetical protein
MKTLLFLLVLVPPVFELVSGMVCLPFIARVGSCGKTTPPIGGS